jgi:protein-S-isoprenylcysteine O-methyltransferase Ste14
MQPIDLCVLAAFGSCFITFTWAMCGGFFVTVGQVPRGVRLIQVLGVVFLVLQAWLLLTVGAASAAAGIAGLSLFAISLTLFLSALRANARTPLSHAFSVDLPRHMTTDGPYRLIRHPCYSAYLLAWLAGAVATLSPVAGVPVIVMLVIYLRAAQKEEAKFAASPLRHEYEAYRERTAMFLPLVY